MHHDTRSKPTRTRRTTQALATAAFRVVAFFYGVHAAAAEPVPAVPAEQNTAVSPSASLPRVIVLATGGTIAGQAASRAADAYNAGSVSAEQLIQAVPGIDKLAQMNTEQVASIGSQDMNDKIWFKLAHRIQQIFDNNEADAIVITHGTDTPRVGSGFVNRSVEVDDDKSGFIVSLDLNPQKARVLTQVLIANGITSPAKAQEAFAGTW